MRLRVAISVFLCLHICQLPLNAQQTATPVQAPPRDPQAIALIQQSIEAMGGAGPVGQIQTVVAMGTIAPVPGSSDASGNVIFEDSLSAQGHEFKDSFQSSGLTQSFVSGHGNPGGVTR